MENLKNVPKDFILGGTYPLDSSFLFIKVSQDWARKMDEMILEGIEQNQNYIVIKQKPISSKGDFVFTSGFIITYSDVYNFEMEKEGYAYFDLSAIKEAAEKGEINIENM